MIGFPFQKGLGFLKQLIHNQIGEERLLYHQFCLQVFRHSGIQGSVRYPIHYAKH